MHHPDGEHQPMATKTFFATAALLAALTLGASTPARALTWTVTQNSDTLSGWARTVHMSGFASPGPYEQVTDVRILYYLSNGLQAQAVGTYNPATGAWAVAVGDYALVSYRVQFRVKYGPNQTYYYLTPLYYWSYR
jgi:hypothetical protein